MLFFRKIIFYIFTAIYIILCPALILYAFGYLYEPGPGGGVVKTGLISLSTAPGSANVYMNGRKYSYKTPTVIRELLPGDYNIALKLKGYRDWERTVEVKEEKAAVFENILLLSGVWKKEISVQGKFVNIIVIPGTEFFILAGSDKLGDHVVYDSVRDKSWPLLDEMSKLKDHKYLSSFTSEGDPSILVRAEAKIGETYFWIRIDDEKNVIKDVTTLFSQKPLDVKWVSGHPDYLFSLQGKYLNRVDVTAGAEYPSYIENVKGYGLYGNEIYIIGADNTFTKMSFDRTEKQVVVKSDDAAASIFSDENYYDVKISEKDIILFLGTGGELSANRLPYKFVDRGVLGTEPYPDTEKIHLWKKDRIGVLDFDEEKTGSVEFEQEPSVKWVYTQGKDIERCFLIYDASHILFLDGNTLFILPLDEDDTGGASKVFTLSEQGTVHYSEDTGKIYFVLNSGSGLMEVEIVPKGQILEGR